MNEITLIGRVGKDIKSVNFADTGNEVAKFSVAVKDYSAKSEGDDTLWIDVDAWNGLADRVLEIVTEGRQTAIHGQLAISKYNKEVGGETVKMLKPFIKLSKFEVLGNKPNVETLEPKASRSRKKLAAVVRHLRRSLRPASTTLATTG